MGFASSRSMEQVSIQFRKSNTMVITKAHKKKWFTSSLANENLMKNQAKCKKRGKTGMTNRDSFSIYF